MSQAIKAVVLAAGKSTRMKSAHSKMAHRILGKAVINFLLDSLDECGIRESDIVIVVGDNESEIRHLVKKNVAYALQPEQLGTAHALLSAQEQIRDFAGDLLVLVGDNPYITARELKRLIVAHRQHAAACTFISAIFPSAPPPYGRVIRDKSGTVLEVVEEIDATPVQLKIREVNSSIYLFDNRVVFPQLFQIGNRNAKKEYYLTDIIKILKQENFTVAAVPAEDYFISIGINNRWELQETQKRFNEENLKKWSLDRGVTILQPESTTIEFDVDIGPDTVIYPSTYIAAGTTIGRDCAIGPFVYLKNASIRDGQQVRFSCIDDEKKPGAKKQPKVNGQKKRAKP